MQKSLIYLDTSIWNVLADQAPDESAFSDALSTRNMQHTLGLNAYYELMRTFCGQKSNKKRRGQRLFTCVHRFLRRGIPLLKTWEELLVEEAGAVASSAFTISPIEENSGFVRTVTAIAQELSAGVVGPQVRSIVSRRRTVNYNVGKTATSNLLNQEDMLSYLQRIQPSEVGAYLDNQSIGDQGRDLLAKYLAQICPQFKVRLSRPAEDLAADLLSNVRNRTAHAIIRNDIYRAWEFARRRQTDFRACVPDDSYHVANASYCQVFVTEDQDGQAALASQAVPALKVMIYQRSQEKFAQWLLRELGGFT